MNRESRGMLMRLPVFRLKRFAPWPPRPVRAAFTLIELLVVIAIISLLIALTSPSLSRSRQSAQAVACKSNFKQMHLAFMLHVNDHHQQLLLHKDRWFYDKTGTTVQLRNYIDPSAGRYSSGTLEKTPTIATCPTLARVGPIYTSISSTCAYNMFAAIEGTGPFYPVDLICFDQVHRPTEMMTFCDSYASATPFEGRYWFGSYARNWSLSELGATRNIHGIPMPYAHHDRAHVVFMDGHVEGLTVLEYMDRSSNSNSSAFWRGHGS